MEYHLALPTDLQAQLAALIQSIPRPRYSDTIRQMLLDNGLVTEDELAELRGDNVATLQAYRARGQMPPHYKWGSLILYRSADIAEMIKSERIEKAALRRRTATKRDILAG